MKIMKKIMNIAKIVAGLAVVVVMLTGCENVKEPSMLGWQQEKVLQYLVDKYGTDEFDIGESRSYRRALGDEPRIETTVVSRDKEPIEFTVISTKDGTPVGETAYIKELGVSFGGSYLEKKWQQEASELYKPLADEVFGEDVLLAVTVDVPNKYYETIKGSMPDYTEIDKSDESIFQANYRTHKFNILMFKDLTSVDFDKEKKNC